MEQTLLDTGISQLTVRKFDDALLLAKCVAEVDDLLECDPAIKVFGKDCHQHRNVGFFSASSTGYKYSGQTATAQRLTPGMLELMQRVNVLYGSEYNGILVNKYKSGSDYIGAHSDDERNLDVVCGVVCVSVGATRTFRIRDKKTKAIVSDTPFSAHDVVRMSGMFQREFTHEIPQQKLITDPRWSFTFRKHTD